MRITILNGSPQAGSFDRYLQNLQHSLEEQHQQVTSLTLRDLNLRNCVGCFGCWVKTPGECVSRDGSIEMDRAIIQADFVLWAAPLIMGFPSALLKMAIDKHLPLIHPYMEVVHNEAHHLRRYPRYPRVGLLVEKESDTDEQDVHIVTRIFTRTALNFKTRLDFNMTTETSVPELAQRILQPPSKPLPLPEYLPATAGAATAPPSRLVLFNGSPRGRRGNTPILLDAFAKGFAGPSEMHHLIRLKDTLSFVDAFAQAECAWLGFPLYTDAMPGSVKQFIEALAPLAGRASNPPLGFLVQSGFPEALHSRYLERYLQKLASRLGSPYLGTIVKGGGEGVRSMPPEMNQRLFSNLSALGAGLSSDGGLDPDVLRRIAHPERFPWILNPVFRLLLRTPWPRQYFDQMLKQNGAYERRFAQPFLSPDTSASE